MPLRTYDTKADFDRDYASPYWSVEDPPGSGQIVSMAIQNPDSSFAFQGYGNREFGLKVGEANATRLIEALGLTTDQTILLVGSGFSWTAEYMESLGYVSVLGIDVSPYIQSNKDVDDETDVDAQLSQLSVERRNEIKANSHTVGPRVRASRGVLNEDGSTGGSRNAIRSALGVTGSDKIDVSISEFVLDTLTDSEAGDVSGMMRNISTRAVHYVLAVENYDPSDPDWNKKTLAEWQTLLSSGDEFLDTRGRVA